MGARPHRAVLRSRVTGIQDARDRAALRGELIDAGFVDVDLRIQAGTDTAGGSLSVLRNMASYASTSDALPTAEFEAMIAEAEAAVEAGRYLFACRSSWHMHGNRCSRARPSAQRKRLNMRRHSSVGRCQLLDV